MREAYIITANRTAVGKSGKGGFKHMRSDDMGAEVIKHMMSTVPELDPSRVDDVIVGCAVPEAEQGMQIGRMISLMSLPMNVSGFVINRYCGSGLESVALGVAKIRSGMADCIIAGGVESMSLLPMMGHKVALNYRLAQQHPDWYLGMGLTAEEVAADYKISREDMDEFSYHSHMKALAAIDGEKFKSQIVPVPVEEIYINEEGQRATKSYMVDVDEGPRRGTTVEAIAKLRPVFRNNGTVTAGNSSQTSDGAAFVLLCSEEMVKELGLKPRARMMGYATEGIDPRIMGMGPTVAVPKVLKQVGLKLNDIEQVELNEAFASQSLACIHELDMNPDIVNVNGGAIALGHPLGCTGAKLTTQLINEMEARGQKYGMVTACVGGGQGVAGVFEVLN
ncbi:MAG: thiolase family protein [Bacteroidota bacterium]